MDVLRQGLRALPVVGPWLTQQYWRLHKRVPFAGSAAYWNQRYLKGGTSGSGSYNRLAAFKAEILNGFVAEHAVGSVLELGCGDGAQLSLAHYPSYIGVDVAPAAVALCRDKFRDDSSKSFYASAELPPGISADMAASLDVIYHLVEDEVFEAYMRDLFARARRFVCVYSSNEDRQAPDQHVRHRNMTGWVRANAPGWTLLRHVPNRYPLDPADPDNTSFADFYFFAKAAGSTG
jgi:SAM-dependent methyltransferase